MPELIHQLIGAQAACRPDAPALHYKNQTISYSELQKIISDVSAALVNIGLGESERVAVYLPKTPEAVFGIFGTAHAGGAFVPVNPLLKPAQVSYILKDCNVRILITSSDRLKLLAETVKECHDLRAIIIIDDSLPSIAPPPGVTFKTWKEFLNESRVVKSLSRIDTHMTAILYTSGSTGKPKGVVLSHRNMVAGARSVAQYLCNTPEDRLLAVLPFSFDYGLSQLTTAFSVGASVTLMDYLLPRDVIKAVSKYAITGLAAVPPLWQQLAQFDWPPEAVASLRYITNSGGAMPKATTRKLRQALPTTDVFLMYGLTEAFRSTYLPPDQVSIRPDSMGKAIPNAEILVVREDGSECAPDEPGELVHKGALVAMGYWNDPEKTSERFKPAPDQLKEIPLTEIAVWSGDMVRKDEEGYLYFISRNDEMIKTSGYRVSPTEVEEVVYNSKLVSEVAALGIPHPTLGQAIVLVAASNDHVDKDGILKYCQRELPNYMIPQDVIIKEGLPRNQNGKIDRKSLSVELKDTFKESVAE
ncbi:MAG: acyl-CoA ligase (AMP-forming), exosortase A system-associated [Sedimenticola sp.]